MYSNYLKHPRAVARTALLVLLACGFLGVSGCERSTTGGRSRGSTGSGEVVSTTFAKTFGTAMPERATAMVEQLDGTYFVAGPTTTFGDGGSNAWILQLDSFGDSISAAKYGITDLGVADVAALEHLPDGSAWVLGNNTNEAVLIRVSVTGQILQRFVVGDAQTGRGLTVLTSGEVIVTGSGAGPSVWAVRVDAVGDVIWEETYGPGAGYAAAETEFGNILIGGRVDNVGTSRPLVIRVDSNSGDELGRHTTGDERNQGTIAVERIRALAGDGYVATGSFPLTIPEEVFMMRGDPDGSDAGEDYFSATFERRWRWAAPLADGGAFLVGYQVDDFTHQIRRLDADGDDIYDINVIFGSPFLGSFVPEYAEQREDGSVMVRSAYYTGDPDGTQGELFVWNLTLDQQTLGAHVRQMEPGRQRRAGGVSPGGSYTVVGNASDPDGGVGGWMLRLDSGWQDNTNTWNTLWEVTPQSGGDEQVEDAVVRNSGEGAVFAGANVDGQESQPLLFAIDGDGQVLWGRSYPSVGGGRATSVSSTPNGYLVSGAWTQQTEAPQLGFVLEVDESGTPIQQRSFSGQEDADVVVVAAAATDDDGDGVADDGFIVLLGRQVGFGAELLKLDANMEEEWRYNDWMPASIAVDVVPHVRNISGGGVSRGFAVLLTLEGFGFNTILVRVDEVGSLDFARVYEGPLAEESVGLEVASGSDLLLAATTYAEGQSCPGPFCADFLLVRLDSEGMPIWQKRYATGGVDIPHTVGRTSDGGFFIAGETDSITAVRDQWVIRTDAFGEVGDSCPSGIAEDVELLISDVPTQESPLLEDVLAQNLVEADSLVIGRTTTPEFLETRQCLGIDSTPTDTFMLTLQVTGAGELTATSPTDSVSCTATCTFEIPAGTEFVFAANPADGWVFSSGSGLDPIILDADHTAQVVFSVDCDAPGATFADGAFADEAWLPTIVELMGGGSSDDGQATAGGNPGEYRFQSVMLDPGASIHTIHIYAPGVYDPMASGAVTSLSYSIDHRIDGPDDVLIEHNLMIGQEGRRHYLAVPPPFLNGSDFSWTNYTRNGILPTDFTMDQGQGPDLGPTGGTFYLAYTRTITNTLGTPVAITIGADNFQAILSGECPETP